jgi:DNA-binding transcriptional MerR regulator
MKEGLVDKRVVELTIGQLAACAAVPVETVRYYERCGLLPQVPRTPAGYRRFGSDALRRLRFIRAAKGLGFTLAEIRELLALDVDPAATCAEVRARALEKLEDIDRRMAELSQIRSALAVLAERCPGARPTTGCAILDAFRSEDLA